MTRSEIQYVLSATRQGDHYYYYRDRYAIDLLSWYVGAGMEIGALRRSKFAFLLEKKAVKEVMARTGGKLLTQELLREHMCDTGTYFQVGTDRWGNYRKHRNDSWYQTSRPGYNLVLQLNFDREHDRSYYELIRPDREDHPFVYYSHPVSTHRKFTLAWTRLDIDLDKGEVLVEEVQTDWLREAKKLADRLNAYLKENKGPYDKYWSWLEVAPEDFGKYFEGVLKPYYRIWQEAILCRALHFSLHELGIRKIFMHTFETGNYLKGLKYGKPPRSLYSKLPEKFGFEKTEEAPEILKGEKYLKKKLRKKGLSWYMLSL